MKQNKLKDAVVGWNHGGNCFVEHFKQGQEDNNGCMFAALPIEIQELLQSWSTTEEITDFLLFSAELRQNSPL